VEPAGRGVDDRRDEGECVRRGLEAVEELIVRRSGVERDDEGRPSRRAGCEVGRRLGEVRGDVGDRGSDVPVEGAGTNRPVSVRGGSECTDGELRRGEEVGRSHV
jgi:hypothetical protein